MSVNSYLNDLATRAIVRDDEKDGIKTSIENIKNKLKNSFEGEISDLLIFGSFKRGTIISRKFDDNSDVDIMVVFKNDMKYKPQTFLNWLKDFANEKYPRSIVKQSLPTIVLELNHIKFELVPAHKWCILNCGMYEIPAPAKDYQEWITTDPNELNDALVKNQILRRLVRVTKIWNAKQGYVYPSYELEKMIVDDSLYFKGDLKEYFCIFCDRLPINAALSNEKKEKISKLKQAARMAYMMDGESFIKQLFE